MAATAQKESAETLNLDIDLDRTSRPESESEFSDLIWDGDVFTYVGMWTVNCSAFKVLETKTQQSLRDHLTSFEMQKKYSMGVIQNLAQNLNYALAQHPTSEFNLAWLVKAVTRVRFVRNISVARSFFMYWKDRFPAAVTSDALQFLAQGLPRRKKTGKNVLSDDPDKSWLTDVEYDAVLRCVWNNYDIAITDSQITLMRLLSLQYGRRPVQLTNLKLCDFRDGSVDSDSISRCIHFPAAKDRGSKKNFRDSKEEVHPVAEHLWDLFQICKYEVKALFEKKLDRTLSEHELAQLPVFTNEAQLEKAVEVLIKHYRIDWRDNLSNQLFHISTVAASRTLAWSSNNRGDNSNKEKRPSPPLSHRTGKPINISATRMRHTRARQLARLGTPKHVLSFWLGHEHESSLDSYYNDPAEEARQINEAMKGALVPLAMAFTGKLIDDESQATYANDPESTIDFAANGNFKNVGKCGKHSFCATTSVPIPCYRCRMFEPLVFAPHQEVLHALLHRQAEENAMIKIGGNRRLLTPIDLGPDIRAVQACIAQCDARKAELEANHD